MGRPRGLSRKKSTQGVGAERMGPQAGGEGCCPLPLKDQAGWKGPEHSFRQEIRARRGALSVEGARGPREMRRCSRCEVAEVVWNSPREMA